MIDFFNFTNTFFVLLCVAAAIILLYQACLLDISPKRKKISKPRNSNTRRKTFISNENIGFVDGYDFQIIDMKLNSEIQAFDFTFRRKPKGDEPSRIETLSMTAEFAAEQCIVDFEKFRELIKH